MSRLLIELFVQAQSFIKESITEGAQLPILINVIGDSIHD